VWLHARIRGIDHSEVDPADRRKSISSERTFFNDLDHDEDLERQLLELSRSVASTLRRKGFRARTITVKIRDHDFNTRQHSRTVPEAVESTAAIYEAARGLFAELRLLRRVPARLLGVGLTGLVGVDDGPQLGLFEEIGGAEREKDRSVSRAMDELEERFGRDVVRPARVIEPLPGRRPRPSSDGKHRER
jgi:DNA polymerase-4